MSADVSVADTLHPHADEPPIALLVDAVASPLTGIGRYASMLARHFYPQYSPDRLRFLGHVGWRSAAEVLAVGNDTAQSSPLLVEEASLNRASFVTSDAFARARMRLSQNRIVTELYDAARKLRTSRALGALRGDWIVHGPNYFAPESRHAAVVTIHDLSVIVHPEWHPAERVRRVTEMLANTVSTARHLIVDSRATRDELIKHYGMAEDFVTAVPLGVDGQVWCTLDEETRRLGHESPLPKCLLGIERFVLCIATFEPRKNIVRLLQAYEALPTDLKQNYPLLLAGAKGWNSDHIDAAITKAERAGWLRVLGYLPDSVLASVCRRASVFVYPSVYEGYGLPILEAMASGVPVVTSSVSSMPEVAAGCALLANPFDESDMSRAIERALTDSPWRASAIAGGLDVAKNATWAKCANLTRAVYRRVVAA